MNPWLAFTLGAVAGANMAALLTCMLIASERRELRARRLQARVWDLPAIWRGSD